MPSASILIKPASANCNIDCKYCFYKCLSSNREEYSMGFMSEETLEKLVKEAIEYADDYLTFAFQGGEPMLAGLDFFRKALLLQEKYRVGKPTLKIENTIQTNGTLLDEEWAVFFHEHQFLVGISLDGPRKINDSARKDGKDQGTFYRVMAAVSLLKKYQVDFNIVSVVTGEAAKKASSLYGFYSRNHFPYIQLIPCMDEIQRQSKGEDKNSYAVTSLEYGQFLCEFFDLWYEDFKAGKIMDVRMFSNLAQMSVGFPPEECGMCGRCKCYFVVEGDGTVYPCDFYCMDGYELGTVDDGFTNLIQSKKAIDFEEASCHMAEECLACKYKDLCRGGCRRFREPFDSGRPGLHILCEGYKLFFEHTEERIRKLGQTILDPGARALL